LSDALSAVSSVSQFAVKLKASHRPADPLVTLEAHSEGIRTADEIIASALAEGRHMLSEFESKKLLAGFGLPVPREILAQNFEEAKKAAQEIRYPVAVKGCAPDLAHKTESDLVRLNVRDEQDLEESCRSIFGKLKHGGELLVQEMIIGKRELVVGMSHDEQFGPCVMFGLGGIFTEILKDVVFRKAPLSKDDAAEMIHGIRGKGIMGNVRGMPAVDLESMIHILMTVGQIAVSEPRIREIDINPLIISGSKPVLVDALIVLK
jgi:acetate---CoA ligase (ADP-forming) subunit beta